MSKAAGRSFGKVVDPGLSTVQQAGSSRWGRAPRGQTSSVGPWSLRTDVQGRRVPSGIVGKAGTSRVSQCSRQMEEHVQSLLGVSEQGAFVNEMKCKGRRED